MPLYEYRCDACGASFELIRKFSDPPLEVCPKCGASPVQKLVSSPAFQFKGSGWYITDYAKKSGGEGAGGSKGDEKPATAASNEAKDAKEAKAEKDAKSGKSDVPAAKESGPAEKPAKPAAASTTSKDS